MSIKLKDTIYDLTNSAVKATKDGSDNTITSTYLKLSGGTMTGALTIESGSDTKFIFNNTDGEKYTKISFRESNTEHAYILINDSTLYWGSSTIYHSGNLNVSNLVTTNTAQTISGTKTFSTSIKLNSGCGINDESGNGILGVGPTGWTGLPSDGSANGFGSLTKSSYIRSSGNNLYHYRNDNSKAYLVLDESNYTTWCAKASHSHDYAALNHNHDDRYYNAGTSRTKNTVLAAPNGSNGAATFRALVAADLPSHNHSSISTAGDNRSDNTTPNSYSNKIIFQGIKYNNKINSPSSDTYSYVVGLRGWSDSSGGYSHEVAFNNSGIYVRRGASTSWDYGWDKVITSGNISSYAAAPDHSHTNYVTLSGAQSITGKKTFSGGIAITSASENTSMPYFLGIDAFADGGTVKYISSNYIRSLIDAAASSHTHNYLPLSGGTISSTSYGPLIIERSGSTNMAAVVFKNSSGTLGSIGMNTVNGNLIIYNAAATSNRTILDSSNYTTWAATKDHNHDDRYYNSGTSRTANTVLAAPNGSAGVASFRKLVSADIPSLAISKITDLQTTLDGKSNTGHTHKYAGSSSAGGSATTALSVYTGGMSGSTHSAAIKSYFESNKSTVPRNKLVAFYSSAYGNGSLYMGYYLSGYEDSPYGGFFCAHYGTPYYVGISNGSFTESTIITSGNYTSYTYSSSTSRTKNTVLAAPNGSAGAATFRALVAADIPTLAISKISGLQTALDGKSDTGHTHSNYVLDTGDTMTGALTISSSSNVSLLIKRSTTFPCIGMYGNTSTLYGYYGFSGENNPAWCTSGGSTVYSFLHSNNWSSYCAAASHNHSASNITSGTLAVARGGTGQTTLNAAMVSLIESLSTATATPSDDNYYIAQDTGGASSYHRRKHSAMYNYIKGKLDSVYSASGHTHSNYVVDTGDTMTGTLAINTSTMITTKYSSTAYNILVNHNNGNVSLSSTGGGLYLGYTNTSAIYCRGSYVNIDSGNYTTYFTGYYSSTTSRTANTVLAAPNGSAGVASFRKLVSADLPSHNHSADNITSGTLAVARGGTGKTTLQDACNALINALSTGSSAPVDADYFVSQYAGGGTTYTTFHRRPVSALYSYMKGKMDSVYSAIGHTHTYYWANVAVSTSSSVTTSPTFAKVNISSYNNSTAILDIQNTGTGNCIRTHTYGGCSAYLYANATSTSASASSTLVVSTGTSGGYAFYCTGKAYVSSTLTQNSDRSLKCNIQELLKQNDLLDKIDNIPVVSFNMKDSGEKKYGFIAQDFLPDFSEVTDYNSDQKTYSLDYNSCFALKIAALERKIKILEQKLIGIDITY